MTDSKQVPSAEDLRRYEEHCEKWRMDEKLGLHREPDEDINPALSER
jgi:hypothetical protein